MAIKYKSGYRNLILWQEAKLLAVLVYKMTEKFPASEKYGLTSQMRRAAISVMSQIAEGWLRSSIKVKLNYLEIAMGSLMELESQGIIAKEVGYWNELKYDSFENQRSKVGYLLFKYRSKTSA